MSVHVLLFTMFLFKGSKCLIICSSHPAYTVTLLLIGDHITSHVPAANHLMPCGLAVTLWVNPKGLSVWCNVY